MFHLIDTDIPLPERLNDPFGSDIHPLTAYAARQLQTYLENSVYIEEISWGKMFGVLVVKDNEGRPGYLAAFSGLLQGTNRLPFFVPPVYDMLDPAGHFKKEEASISKLNTLVSNLLAEPPRIEALENLDRVKELAESELSEFRLKMSEAKRLRDEARVSGAASEEALIRESQFLKAEFRRLKKRHETAILEAQKHSELYEGKIRSLKRERQERSDSLQRWLFAQFEMLNARGQRKNLNEIFSDYASVHNASEKRAVPPGGTGECCAPKLLQYAYLNGYEPLGIAEFWWGRSPVGEVRHHLQYYPACQGKCRPILEYMLEGTAGIGSAEENRLKAVADENRIEMLFEDDRIMVVNKPSGLPSVPGKNHNTSVLQLVSKRIGKVFSVHRLDMDTSGILVLAKDAQAHRHLQEQFTSHSVSKTYVALITLGKDLKTGDSGIIDLPLIPDYLDRPRQKVDFENGKPAVTEYKVISVKDGLARLELRPVSGRTHQLRVHCAHSLGLGCPILGDRLYGTENTNGQRLYLHAAEISFHHPVSGKPLTFRSDPEF